MRRFDLRFSSCSGREVRKVGQTLGWLQAAWIAGVPNLPNLPNLFSVLPLYVYAHTYAHAHAYARAPIHITQFLVGKVRKVRKGQQRQGFRASQPLPYLPNLSGELQ